MRNKIPVVLLLLTCLAASASDVVLMWDGPAGCTGACVGFRVYEWRSAGAWNTVTNIGWPTQMARLHVQPGSHWYTVTTVSNGLESEFPRWTNRPTVQAASAKRTYTQEQVNFIVGALVTNRMRLPPKP